MFKGLTLLLFLIVLNAFCIAAPLDALGNKAEQKTDDRHQRSTNKYDSKTLHWGILKSVEHAPGSIFAHVEANNQIHTLYVTTLLHATYYGPPNIGEKLFWRVLRSDNDFYSRELDKTFASVHFVDLFAKFPRGGIIQKVKIHSFGVEYTIDPSRDVDSAYPIIIVCSKACLDYNDNTFSVGDEVRWHDTKLISQGRFPQSLTKIAVNSLSKYQR